MRSSDDYERLIALIPPSGKAETLGGEIMRAVNVLSKGKTNRVEALSFLTKVGVLSKEDKDLHSQLNVGETQGEEPSEAKVLALETLKERAISLILLHPDLEYVENEDGFVGCEPEPDASAEATRTKSSRTTQRTSARRTASYNI
jgi:hypothetical protein